MGCSGWYGAWGVKRDWYPCLRSQAQNSQVGQGETLRSWLRYVHILFVCDLLLTMVFRIKTSVIGFRKVTRLLFFQRPCRSDIFKYIKTITSPRKENIVRKSKFWIKKTSLIFKLNNISTLIQVIILLRQFTSAVVYKELQVSRGFQTFKVLKQRDTIRLEIRTVRGLWRLWGLRL